MPRILATAASIFAALVLDTPLGEVASSTMGREMAGGAAGAGAGAGTPAWSQSSTLRYRYSGRRQKASTRDNLVVFEQGLFIS